MIRKRKYLQVAVDDLLVVEMIQGRQRADQNFPDKRLFKGLLIFLSLIDPGH